MDEALRSGSSSKEIEDLTVAFTDRRATIGIIGLGYVGLPLAITSRKAGFSVIGFDIDQERVRQINRGESIIRHISSTSMKEALDQGFQATANFQRLAEADAILICVPTPLTLHREPDLSYVVSTANP